MTRETVGRRLVHVSEAITGHAPRGADPHVTERALQRTAEESFSAIRTLRPPLSVRLPNLGCKQLLRNDF
jgi:hypothetical protein